MLCSFDKSEWLNFLNIMFKKLHFCCRFALHFVAQVIQSPWKLPFYQAFLMPKKSECLRELINKRPKFHAPIGQHNRSICEICACVNEL
jgi:hypothetical protein